MRVLQIVLALIAVLVVLGDAYVRLAPLPSDRFHRQTAPQAAGDYPSKGGIVAVRDVSDPKAQMVALDKIIRASARTRVLNGSVATGHISYVTRSALWGFPDITNLYVGKDTQAGSGTLTISGHLVFGAFDLGVNAARIKGWLDEAGL